MSDSPMHSTLGRLNLIPIELFQEILMRTRDVSLCIRLEAIIANLPLLFTDGGQAMSSIDLEAFFPASLYIINKKKPDRKNRQHEDRFFWRRRDPEDHNPPPISLLEVAFNHKLNSTTPPRVLQSNLDSLKIVQYLHNQPTSEDTFAQHPKTHTLPLDQAASKGYFATVKFITENRSEPASVRAMDGAASNGFLDIVQYLHETRSEGCSADAMDNAATNGFLSIVRFLTETRTEGCTVKAMDRAASNGHLDIVRYLNDSRTEGCTTLAIDNAAARGFFDVVRFLMTNRKEGFTNLALVWSAANDHLEILQYLHESNISPVATPADAIPLLDQPCLKGHLEVVNYLLSVNALFTTIAFDHAAANGHLNVIQLLHKTFQEQNVSLCTKTAMDLAAACNHLKVLTFLHTHRTEGCTHLALDLAVENKCSDSIITFLLENRSEGCSAIGMDAAIRRNDLDLVKRLARAPNNGCTPAAVAWAAGRGHLPMLKFLHESKVGRFRSSCVEEASAFSKMETLLFLLDEVGVNPFPEALERACENGFKDIVKVLQDHGCTSRVETLNIQHTSDGRCCRRQPR
ncbi:hypothetical protein HDU97_009938 [Phlyctochytrium planicorne]|nr:hypothetical protein HDU97_009938 [Phlyctochytrium planicorne]